MKLQLTAGGVYEVIRHHLSGKRVRTRYFGDGTIVGIRTGASAREKFAFVIQHGKTFALVSRVNFTILDEPDAGNPDLTCILAAACGATVTDQGEQV